MDHYTAQNFMHTQSVGFALSKARNLIVLEMDVALKGVGITTQQMGILTALQSGAAATPLELSKRLGIDSSLMTRMLDRLEAKGLLVRSRNAADRRVVNLKLTERGKASAARIPEIAPQVLNARLKAFTEAEFEELCRLLHKFVGD